MLALLLDHWAAIIGLEERITAVGPERLDRAGRFLNELSHAGSEDGVRGYLADRDDPTQQASIDDVGVLLLQMVVQRMRTDEAQEHAPDLLDWLRLVAQFTTGSVEQQAHACFLGGLLALEEEKPSAARDAFQEASELYAALASLPLAERAAHCGMAEAAADLDADEEADREFRAALASDELSDTQATAWKAFIADRQEEFANRRRLIDLLAAAPVETVLSALLGETTTDLRRAAMRTMWSRTLRFAVRSATPDCLAAARLADRLAASIGKTATATRRAAQVCEHENRWDSAEALFRAALETDPTDRAAEFGIARAVLNIDRFSEAASLLESLAERSPKDADVAIHLGITYHGLNRIADARLQFERSLALDPDEPMARTLLSGLPKPAAGPDVAVDEANGTIYLPEELLKGDPKSVAVQIASAMLAVLPEQEQQSALAEIAREEGADHAARVAAMLAQRRAETAAVQHFARAEALFGRRDFPAALLEYKEVLRLDPDRGDALMGLGDCHFSLGQFHLAAAYFEESLDVAPSAPTARFLSDAYYRVGRIEQAIEACRRSVETDPNYTLEQKQLNLLLAAQTKLRRDEQTQSKEER
jgi:tetratricopeptide (TPR) repeat protein